LKPLRVKAAKNKKAFIYPLMNVYVNKGYMPRTYLQAPYLKYGVCDFKIVGLKISTK